LPTRGAGTADGDWATVMLRPEQILCQGPSPLDGAEGTRGRVLSTAFYGHDATARIALDGPDRREIVARAAGHLLPRAGEEVAIAVEGTALAYPTRRAGQRTAIERLPAFG
jgi:hypothetical protein